jgi:hypothetical protein
MTYEKGRTAAAERHRKGKKGETGDMCCRQHGRAEESGKRTTAMEMAVQAAVRAGLGETRRLAEAGRREGVLTYDIVGVARKWLPTLPGQAKRTSVNLIRSDPPPRPPGSCECAGARVGRLSPGVGNPRQGATHTAYDNLTKLDGRTQRFQIPIPMQSDRLTARKGLKWSSWRSKSHPLRHYCLYRGD